MAKKKNTTQFNREKCLDNILAIIKKRHGLVEPEWQMCAEELTDLLELKALCLANVREIGLIDPKTNKPNEFLSKIASLESHIFHYMQEMGFSLKSSKRVRELTRRAGKNSDSDLLSALIGKDDEDDE